MPTLYCISPVQAAYGCMAEGKAGWLRHALSSRTHQFALVPIKVFEAIVIPGGNAPQGGVTIQEGASCKEEGEEVWTEEHVIFDDYGMAVLSLSEHLVQAPFVMLCQPGMPWLHAQNILNVYHVHSLQHLGGNGCLLLKTWMLSGAVVHQYEHQLRTAAPADGHVMLCQRISVIEGAFRP